MLYFARRYDEAIHEYEKNLEMNPDDVYTRLYLGWAYLKANQFAEAVAQLEKWVDPTGRRRVGPLAHAYVSAGRIIEAQELLDELLGLPNTELFFPGDISLVYTALGEKDIAFAWLDKAADAFDSRLFQLQDPLWDPLRDDPRFKSLLRRLNLPVQ
jgi:tetratricopeptide (TPR) repeat protein